MCPFTSVMSAFVVETAFLKGLMQVTVILVNICINFYWSKHHQKKGWNLFAPFIQNLGDSSRKTVYFKLQFGQMSPYQIS